MNAYLICSAILVILYFLLAFNVSLTRQATKTGIGPGPDLSGRLNKAVRAHGNAAEYIPIFVLLFLYFLTTGASGWITWVVVIVTICRVLHPVAIFLSPDLNKGYPLRFITSFGTYVGGLALGGALLMRALM
jgi:uncharacterized membrane protein YecN with MAPEG domain